MASLDSQASEVLQSLNKVEAALEKVVAGGDATAVANLQSVNADVVATVQKDEKGVEIAVQAVAQDAAVDASAVATLKAVDVGVNELINKSSEAGVTTQ